MYKIKHCLFLLTIMMIFLSTSCQQNDTENILQHPAISLAERDSSHIFVNPTWSPDGNLLAVRGVAKCLLGNCSQEIYILELSTGDVSSFRNGWSRYLTWTSDPQVVSFVDYDRVPGGIYITSFNGNTSPEFVVEGDTPVWAPDGSHLAFRRVRREANQDKNFEPGIFVLDLETNFETHIFEITGKEVTGVSWSYDSNWLAISARWKTNNDDFDSGLFIVGRDGEDLHQLIERGTTIGSGIGWMPNSQWLFYIEEGRLNITPLSFDCVVIPLEIDINGISSPTISPDGEKIAFEHEGNIYLLELDELLGENRERLACQ